MEGSVRWASVVVGGEERMVTQCSFNISNANANLNMEKFSRWTHTATTMRQHILEKIFVPSVWALPSGTIPGWTRDDFIKFVTRRPRLHARIQEAGGSTGGACGDSANGVGALAASEAGPLATEVTGVHIRELHVVLSSE